MFDNRDKNCPIVGLLKTRDACLARGADDRAWQCEEAAWRLWEAREAREQAERQEARRERGEPYYRGKVLVCPPRIAAGAFDAPPQWNTRG